MSLYNKYRPSSFKDIRGSISADILQKQIKLEKTSHAYIFSGPPGTGKTTIARVAAKSLLCSENIENCHCSVCKSIINDNHPDVYEINCAVNNGVDNVRENIVSLARLAPVSGKYKIFILDECHMLTTQAQTSLIKLVEEPPSFVKFFFCTTESNKILRAIQTRCQIFTMKKLSDYNMFELLKDVCESENFKYEPEALDLIIKESDGSARTALSILEQTSINDIEEDFVRDLLNRSPKQLCYRLVNAIIDKDKGEAFRILQGAYLEGRSMNTLILETSSMFLGAFKILAMRIKKEDRDPYLERVCKLTQSVDIIEIADQLYKISSSIRQTVSEDIVTITGVLKTIDWYTEKCKGYKID
jgi:DNA polymerase-3 subunit gamma/tau